MEEIGGKESDRVYKAYNDYTPKQKGELLARVQAYKDSEVPIEKWDPKIQEFFRHFEKYLYSSEDDANSANVANPH